MEVQSLPEIGQFDDPNATAALISKSLTPSESSTATFHWRSVEVLKKLKIPYELGPNKLKQAYGDHIVSILARLCDACWGEVGLEKPTHKNNEYSASSTPSHPHSLLFNLMKVQGGGGCE